MAQLGAEALVTRLIEWGVDTVHGLPSDGINGIVEGTSPAGERTGARHSSPTSSVGADAGSFLVLWTDLAALTRDRFRLRRGAPYYGVRLNDARG